MAHKRCTRAEDEFLLHLIRLRANHSSTELAERFGMTAPDVRIKTNRVRNADLDESGEPAAEVLPAYGWSA
jgi:hypothetical protein